VRRRGWLDHQRFLDLLAATNLIPGPNSTEMAMHLGRLRAGLPGLVAGGAAFILPSAVLVTAFAALYVHAGGLPSVETVLATLRPAVVVVVADALVRFARQAVRGIVTAAIAVLAAAAALAGVGEIAIVAGALLVGVTVARLDARTLHGVPLLELAAVCLKIGATLFGSGYVLIAYLRAEMVGRGWLADRALLDAVAIGQVTPGPVSTAATFVGYLVAGVPGAVVATVAIFLPAFVLVAATGPLVERWRDRPAVRRTLDLVNAAVVGLIAAVVIHLVPSAFVSPLDVAVGVLAVGLRWTDVLGPTGVLLWATAAGVARAFVAG
jgi:chromate transporter